ncbi:MAG: hypothetical protein WA628_05495 [Terriglobales bacterium]
MSSVVFIITGATESGRSTVGRLLAENLGWEFVDAEHFHDPRNSDVRRCSALLATADPQLRIQTLSAAIDFWIYEWRDVVVSCPVLSGKELSQLSTMSRLVKIVCLEASRATDRSRMLDQSVPVMGSESSDGRHAAREPGQHVFAVDSSRLADEIVAEIVTVLTMRPR